MGTVDKIHLRYSEPWWPADSEGMAFLYHETPIRYDSELASENWTRFAMGVYPVDHRPDVLAMWVCGEGAKVMEARTDAEVRADVGALMEKFLRKAFPGMTEPEEIKVKDNIYT